ncbi:phage head-tail joining protein [Pseudomonas aeruginosa]|uniref:phage head-tail joining protein n=1 Tax=Pseudomonas aeruginosa TaxID=287 RepID=UPI003D7F324A
MSARGCSPLTGRKRDDLHPGTIPSPERGGGGGALSVRYADRSVTYRSIEEMLRILRLMEDELGLSANNDGGRRYTSFSKGY